MEGGRVVGGGVVVGIFVTLSLCMVRRGLLTKGKRSVRPALRHGSHLIGAEIAILQDDPCRFPGFVAASRDPCRREVVVVVQFLIGSLLFLLSQTWSSAIYKHPISRFATAGDNQETPLFFFGLHTLLRRVVACH